MYPSAPDVWLRQAAIDTVLSEALTLAGFGPLVAHPLTEVLSAAGLKAADPGAALDGWSADRLLAVPTTRAVLRRLARRRSTPRDAVRAGATMRSGQSEDGRAPETA